MNLAVDVGSLHLKNPLIAASGTFGYGVEYEGMLDLAILGGLVSKGLYLEARDGCATAAGSPSPRRRAHAATPSR